MEKQDQAESAVGGEGDQSVLGTEGEYYSVTIWVHKDTANFFSVILLRQGSGLIIYVAFVLAVYQYSRAS